MIKPSRSAAKNLAAELSAWRELAQNLMATLAQLTLAYRSGDTLRIKGILEGLSAEIKRENHTVH